MTEKYSMATGEFMDNYNAERISRKARTLQWSGSNTDAVMAVLAQNKMIGETYRGFYICAARGCNYHTLRHGDWLVVGEDNLLRFYTDEKYQLMYRPRNEDLERLRAFARFAIKRHDADLCTYSMAIQLKLLVPRECGRAFDLAESLKVPEQLNNKGE